MPLSAQTSAFAPTTPYFRASARPARHNQRMPIGQILVEMGDLSPNDLAKALAIQAREETRIGNILINHNMVTQTALYGALSLQFGADLVDLTETPPQAHLITDIGIEQCIAENIIPWKHIGGAYVIVTSRPDQFERLREGFLKTLGPVLMAIAPEHDIQATLIKARADTLITRAETRVPDNESCRQWDSGRLTRFALAGFISFLAFMITSPQATVVALCVVAIIILVLNTCLKLLTAISQFFYYRDQRKKPKIPQRTPEIARLPVVSIMVPLFKEREVATHLIRRLKRLNYPKELLDICLVVEQDDITTCQTLSKTVLPNWVRTIKVPTGSIRTKPRAMNFALDFCRGTIIGVYDAEDAPHPDQIHTVVRRFHERGPQVACLQGILDFYNARTNWLSRCFTIEYATWFRVFLPGLERLGFAVPLGGTTLFFRRAALEKLGGWDAHNVTEDADLGIRLARYGYRTEMIDSVTEEEANCRLVPWVKQRSRWLKGFAITWTVHMKSPYKLFKDMGFRKFVGFQILLMGTLTQFLLAPVLWSFWSIPLGFGHPILNVISPTGLTILATLFLSAELITIMVSAYAVSDRKHRFLTLWVPTMHFYFPLGAFAAYKAVYELMTRPFYWDKTTHGVFKRTEQHDPTVEAILLTSQT